MLFRHYLRRERSSLVGWSLAVPMIIFPMMGLYQVMRNSDGMRELNRMMEQLPPAIKALTGSGIALSTINGWLHSMVLASQVPLFLAVYTALAALGVLTREADGHTLEFLLSLPVRRAGLIISRLGGLAVNLAALHGLLLLSVGASVRMLGEAPDWRGYALILLNQYLIYVALAALLVLVTVFVDDLQKGLMVTLSVAVGMFFLARAIPAESPVAALGRLSLFYYYRPSEVMAQRTVPSGDALVLLAVTALCTGAAVWLFERKQL